MRFASVAALLPLALASPMADRSEPAPLYLHETETAIVARGGSDKFIIKFKAGSPAAILEQTIERIKGGEVIHRFQNNLLGFTARLDRPTVEILRWIPGVEYIEQDTTGASTGYKTADGAPWGLGRISHRSKGSDSYTYDESGGKGVCVYVTDSGVDESHPEFEGRAHQIKSYIEDSDIDDLGHGTHCAGTIGSATYGVAKKVDIYGVKVISKEDRFWYSDLIAAYDFIRNDAKGRDCPNGIVVSGSLGGGYSKSMNAAANSMVEAGYFMAIAAGNDNEDVSNHSPGSASKVCTVGGTAADDKRYSHSNYGPGVNINGPAVGVLSTLPNNKTAYYTGTSMATPHIAGLAAYLAVLNGTKVTPSMCQTIINLATKDKISNQVANTVNLIAYNGNTLDDTQ
ncbi:hypothetical protein NLG97_g6145 [Lecanicillium saksenae]|uniref:Uncharacterized protein n=1 Tax=Lecanicillium saksenae TaxID=468837 RepID=A0ACC1QQH0_9HYPO|nr:hypothetical protein NLG97_g6145 [Lecanicillium saksenae]